MRFSFTDTDCSQDSRGRKWTALISLYHFHKYIKNETFIYLRCRPEMSNYQAVNRRDLYILGNQHWIKNNNTVFIDVLTDVLTCGFTLGSTIILMAI